MAATPRAVQPRRRLRDVHSHSRSFHGSACARIDAAAYAEFRTGLLNHIGMEEKILLPAAPQARGAQLERPASGFLSSSKLSPP
jgi:hypothetical protein